MKRSVFVKVEAGVLARLHIVYHIVKIIQRKTNIQS